MQINELIQGLSAKLEQSRIVFWHDAEHGFLEDIDSIISSLTDQNKEDKLKGIELLPDNLTILKMTDESILETKKKIEFDEPNQKFLLYFSENEPTPENDWLLDIRLYSETFFADRSSMLLNELGIPKISLKEHIKNRNAFFGNKKRIAGLKKWVTENEDELSLDRKMIAVTVSSDSAELDSILLTLLDEYAKNINANIDESSLSLWKALNKYELSDSLWTLLDSAYGYRTPEPSLEDFVFKLFCTDYSRQINADDKAWLSNNLLQTGAGQANAMAFMSSWRDSRTYADSYAQIAGLLAYKLEIKAKSANYRPAQMVDCQTFEEIEQNIIIGLVDSLIEKGGDIESAQFDAIVSRRSFGYWAKLKTDYESIYSALGSAKELMQIRSEYAGGFSFNSAREMYNAYVDDLYKFDQAYRLFSEKVNFTLSKGWEILRGLKEEVENLYINWYLHELGLAWDQHLEEENLLESWKLEDIPNQYDFYNQQVQTILTGTQIKRVFVIISDAFRYEIAHELDSIINNEKRFKSDLSTQLGVLPSYTQLGMASLLPHKSLYYDNKGNSTVFVDEVSSQGLIQRNKILQSVGGVAVSSKDLMNWNNEEGREKVRNASVVYIYHDTIDAIGDKQGSEHKTFEACRDAINELKSMVGRVINRLNGSRVIITADHGFLFQNKKLTTTDKTGIDVRSAMTNENKKRYIVGRELRSDEPHWKGKISNTANGAIGEDKEVEFIIPKSSQRFHFSGGAQFVHGGAMLQEICVPVITVRELPKEQVAKYEKTPVGVISAKQSIKFVNNIDKVSFIQTDAVSSEHNPRKLHIYIVDTQGVEVSSKETLVFGSSSSNMDERRQEATLSLIGSNFNRNDKYALVLLDADTNTEYTRYDVTIDLAIQDEFF
tara:strand:- start:897 stop:3563 length:2667 start_codon:yes stop_codon:yes gene_type:complete